MRILFGIHSLAGGGGTETYVLTVADQLQRSGHDVWIYSVEGGFWQEQLENVGLRVVIGEDQLPAEIDVALPQDAPSAYELLAARPAVPQVYIWHSNLFDLQLAPQISDATRLIVTLYGEKPGRIESLAVRSPVLSLRQPIDLQRFSPGGPIAERPRKAVAISNYLTGDRREILVQACERAGIELKIFGGPEGAPTSTPEAEINSADIVFGKARVILEAMACGRAAFVYDVFGTDGWVTPENFDDFYERGMAGSKTDRVAGVEEVAAELAAYDPAMGARNRDLALHHFSVIRHCGALVEAIEQALAGDFSPPQHDQAAELARMSRASGRHELQAFGLNARLQAQSIELANQTARAERAEAQLATIAGSARWRALDALMRPFDRLRGRG